MDYKAFLLRFWREGRRARWRVSLEEPASQQRRAFASMEALFDFLEGALGEAEGPEPIKGSAGDEEKES